MKARKIELKTLDFTAPDGSAQNIPYNEFLQVVITSAGPGGLSSDDVLKAVEIKQELKSANGVLNLSEADYNWLVGRMNTTVKWSLANEQLAEFIKDVRAAPLVDVEAKC